MAEIKNLNDILEHAEDHSKNSQSVVDRVWNFIFSQMTSKRNGQY